MNNFILGYFKLFHVPKPFSPIRIHGNFFLWAIIGWAIIAKYEIGYQFYIFLQGYAKYANTIESVYVKRGCALTVYDDDGK